MGVLRGTAQWKELSGTFFFSSARSSLLKNMKLLVVVVVTLAGMVSGMDVGKGGVYDSPMAQDYYVKRFGFMFGGGRSGMYGLEALQKTAEHNYQSHLPSTLYNPSGLYGLRAMRNSIYDFPQLTQAKPSSRSSYSFPRRIKEKQMVELSPLNRKQQTFNRFMAVP